MYNRHFGGEIDRGTGDKNNVATTAASYLIVASTAETFLNLLPANVCFIFAIFSLVDRKWSGQTLIT